MGMAADQFLRQPADDIPDIEVPFLPGDLGVKDHLKQDIPQLLGHRLEIFLPDRLQKFIGLLQQVFPQAPVGLFPVPGTALRPPQVGDDLRQRVEPPAEDPGVFGGGT